MPKLSAGILLYRKKDSSVEVLLVHPGGPFWASKDAGSWSLPKGEYAEGTDALAAAKREFREETGHDLPSGTPTELGEVKYNNKILRIWTCEGSIDARQVRSNTFTIEWPPKTGRKQEFPEVDRAGWFTPSIAREKLVEGQASLIELFEQMLGIDATGQDNASQLSLL